MITPSLADRMVDALRWRGPARRLFWALGFLACTSASVAASETIRTLTFATYASERPSEELVKMEPIRLAIEKSLNAKTTKYRVLMRIFTSYDEAVDASASGTVDLSRLGPASYVHAKNKNPRLHLLACESKDKTNILTGHIFVSENSAIKELKDVRGHRFAFGEANSTAGRYLPQAALIEAGIHAKDLAEYKYLGRHDKVAFAVGTGSFDVGAANELTFRKYGETKNLRSIFTSKAPTHAWVVRSDLPVALRRDVHAALLTLTADDMARIGRDGFLPARDSDYDEVRAAMKRAERFFE